MALTEWQWYEFTAPYVGQVPEAGGVYVLGSGSGTTIFYVGQSGGLRSRLSQHLYEAANPCIQRHLRAGGTSFAYKTVMGGEAARLQEEQSLVRSHTPECNA